MDFLLKYPPLIIKIRIASIDGIIHPPFIRFRLPITGERFSPERIAIAVLASIISNPQTGISLKRCKPVGRERRKE
jgi:hypothetical protein